MQIPIACALLVLAAGCSSTSGPPRLSPGEIRSELLAVDREFSQAAQTSSRVDAFRQYLAADATSMPLGRPFVHGREAILASMQGASADEQLAWTPHFADASERGDLGYTYGTWVYTFGPREARVELQGKYVTIWRRQNDGK